MTYTWTHKQPKSKGWYFLTREGMEWVVGYAIPQENTIHFKHLDGLLMILKRDKSYMWAGPIQEPL